MLKFEIEIPEEELNAVVTQKVRQRLNEQAAKYTAESYIGRQVEAHWTAAVDRIVAEEFANLETIREMVRAKMQKKVEGQLQKLFSLRKKQEMANE